VSRRSLLRKRRPSLPHHETAGHVLLDCALDLMSGRIRQATQGSRYASDNMQPDIGDFSDRRLKLDEGIGVDCPGPPGCLKVRWLAPQRRQGLSFFTRTCLSQAQLLPFQVELKRTHSSQSHM
jgi:hypothetical protein